MHVPCHFLHRILLLTVRSIASKRSLGVLVSIPHQGQLSCLSIEEAPWREHNLQQIQPIHSVTGLTHRMNALERGVAKQATSRNPGLHHSATAPPSLFPAVLAVAILFTASEITSKNAKNARSCQKYIPLGLLFWRRF